MTNSVLIVGAGLAGCEAAWQLARRGVAVRLVDMKPKKFSPAHHMEGFAELVCSNSLKAEHLTNASGLLKAEMRLLDSLILRAADEARVPAGGALAVAGERRLCFLGDGVNTYRDAIVERLGERAVIAPAHMRYLRPASVGELAWLNRERSVDYLALMPVYLRAPQAERERARRLGGRA